MSFVIDANLDIEATWSGVALPGRVRVHLGKLAPLLGALAPPDARDVEICPPGASPARADLRWADPGAKAANDRRLARATFPMPGAREIASLDELDDARGPWVCKARWTAAGRDRARGDGPPTGELRVFVARLLARFGTLIFEPWLDRSADAGACAWIGTAPPPHLTGATPVADRLHAWPPHRIVTDARGGFRGIAPDAPADLDLTDAVIRAGRAIAELGYTGPFAVDALVHAGGLHICEINARYTFGFVARARGGALDLSA